MMRTLYWALPLCLTVSMLASAAAGETAAVPAKAGALDERVDFNSDNVALADILKLLESKKIGYVLPAVWEGQETALAERMANAGDRARQVMPKGMGKVTMKLSNVPLRVVVQQFAKAYGVECGIMEGEGYQVVVFHDEDGARIEGNRGRGMRGGFERGPGGPGGQGGQGGPGGQGRGPGRGQQGGNQGPAAPAENF